MRRRQLLLATPALLAARQARADWAPAHAVNLIVPLAPGSTADMLARTMAEAWSPRLGQPVTVDNRPAGGGVVATEALKNAAPDGTTLGLVSQGTLVFNHFLYRQQRYDPVADFALVAPFATVTNAMVVSKHSAFHSPADIVAAARARPGTVTFSSGGNGTSHHISMALFAQLTGTELVHVPYRGAPAGITAAMTNEVGVGCYNIPTVLEQVRAGELRALAVTSAGRSEFLPETPSLQELGFSGYELTTWMGLAAPARTPEPILRRMAAETNLALDDAPTWARLVRQGFEPMPRLDPAGFRALLQAELAKWGPIIRAAGANLD